jgi:sulfate transport system substrate-binding protein
MKRYLSDVSLVLSLATIAFMLFLVGTFLHHGTTPLSDTLHCVPINPELPEKTLVHVSIYLAQFYNEYDKLFEEKWECETGQIVHIEQEYGPSGEYMRSIVGGTSKPDIVTLSHPQEIDTIVDETAFVSPSWRDEFPYESSPAYGPVTFLVRKGNPNNIHSWDDLVRPDVEIVVSDPKLCGGGRWVFEAVLGHEKIDKTDQYVSKFYSNIPILYPGQGDSAIAFTEDNVGDVLTTYEWAVLRTVASSTEFEAVYPTPTVLIEPSVAIVKKYTEENGTTDIARAYVQGLYEPSVQEIIAKNNWRPRIVPPDMDLSTKFPEPAIYSHDELSKLGSKELIDELF